VKAFIFSKTAGLVALKFTAKWNSFTGVFKDLGCRCQNTDFKEHLLVAASGIRIIFKFLKVYNLSRLFSQFIEK